MNLYPIHRDSPRHERGVAMLEFVLMLPFIFVMLLLIFNFGQALVERQRALIAVREMAIRHGLAIGGAGDVSIEPTRDRVIQDILTPRGMSGDFFIDRTGSGGECP